MDQFCGSPFWDTQLTWNKTDPYLTHCCEQVVLGSTPFFFLLIFAGVDIANLWRARRTHFKEYRTPIFYLRTGLILCLAGLSTTQLVRLITEVPRDDLYAAEYVIPSLQVLGLVLVVFLSILRQRAGIYSSGVQFLFWLLTLLSQIILFRTAMHKLGSADEDKHEITYITRLISMPISAVCFVLECVSDRQAPKNAAQRHSHIKPSPDKTSTFLVKILLLWYDGLAWAGYTRVLSIDDLWELNPLEQSAHQSRKFSKHWKNENWTAGQTNHPGILKPILKGFGVSFAFGLLLRLSADLLVFVQPEMLKLLVSHLTADHEPAWRGYLFTTTLVAGTFLQSILKVESNKRALLIGMRIRAAISAAVFRKTLVLSSGARRKSTAGKIVNLMAVDTQRFMDLLPMINFAIGAPVQIAIAVWLLFNTLGGSVVAGGVVLVMAVPVNMALSSYAHRLQIRLMQLKDERVKLTAEVLGGIKVLKMYGWEPSYLAQIEAIRTEEIVCLRRIAGLNVLTAFTFNCVPVLVVLATFATYVLSDTENNVLDAEKTFVALALFNIIRMPTVILPTVIATVVHGMVSVKRLNRFLNLDELDDDQNSLSTKVSHCPDAPITICDASFSWAAKDRGLTNINLTIESGEMVAVVGSIGAGKSSLLHALLGDLRQETGSHSVNGSVAYVAQEAWIQNATLRDNILFGDEFDQLRYDRVLEACALKPDLAILHGGDQAEIGEKGVNLSGGQKQRVALARAAYKNKGKSSIYLLDDPLSAVDAHVRRHIFEELIGPNGILANSTRLLVTHDISLLPSVDRIIVMNNGRISEEGSYNQLVSNSGKFATFLATNSKAGPSEDDVVETDSGRESLLEESVQDASILSWESEASLDDQDSFRLDNCAAENTQNPKKTTLITAEAMQEGNVQLKVYTDYLRSAGVKSFMACIALIIVSNALTAYSNVWLANWSDKAGKVATLNSTTANDVTRKYLVGYGVIGLVQAAVTLLGTWGLALICITSSTYIHSSAISRVVRAPLYYFDTTPLGRLMNRFSKDLDTIDNLVPLNVRAFTNMLANVFASLAIICYTTPIFTAFIVPMIVVYIALQRFYITTSRQLKRFESVTRSPIYSHFGETIAGVSTIRAFGMQEQFVAESEGRVDLNHRAYFPFIIANMWISLRLEFMGCLIILATCIFVLASRESLSPGEAGLAISYSIQVTGLLNFLARQMSELETNVVSVERVAELNEVPQEAAWERKISDSRLTPPDWPAHGEVRFGNYRARYREGLDFVLDNINCTIQPGEKVGVVGRTGAGKSSLSLALFRILEAAGGCIYIDKVDISTLGLHELRRRLTIIPQDPVLFSGTLRLNLDPDNEYSDVQLWRCLELAHLRPYVASCPAGLDHVIEEEGSNLSIGQRQLICLARALLRKTRILVMDEATASLDLETDNLLQMTIRKEFVDSTVITIAHRVHTIMDSDRVMVLHRGQVIEFAAPEKLLADSNSAFWAMACDAKITKSPEI